MASMKAKVKGKWQDYDYSINFTYLTPDKIILALKENTGKDYKYLGKAKAVKDRNGNVSQLQRRHLFFKLI